MNTSHGNLGLKIYSNKFTSFQEEAHFISVSLMNVNCVTQFYNYSNRNYSNRAVTYI